MMRPPRRLASSPASLRAASVDSTDVNTTAMFRQALIRFSAARLDRVVQLRASGLFQMRATYRSALPRSSVLRKA